MAVVVLVLVVLVYILVDLVLVAIDVLVEGRLVEVVERTLVDVLVVVVRMDVPRRLAVPGTAAANVNPGISRLPSGPVTTV